MMSRRFLVLAVAVGVAFACGDGDPDADAASAFPLSDRAAAEQEARDAEAVREFTLTMDGVRRYVEATERFYGQVSGDRALLARMEAVEADADPENMDQVVEQIESIPEWRAAIRAAGLSVDDYVLTMASISAVGVYVALRDMGYDAGPQDWVSDRNVRFFEENRPELEALMQRLEGFGDLFDDEDDAGW